MHFKRQVTVKHKSGSRLFGCSDCELKFESKWDLKTHEELEHEFYLDCDYCDFKCNEIGKMFNMKEVPTGQNAYNKRI